LLAIPDDHPQAAWEEAMRDLDANRASLTDPGLSLSTKFTLK
jgi:hypothetical protein